jgi:hypothetical protein
MKKYVNLIAITVCGLFTFLLFMLYQDLKLTEGGSILSSQSTATLPLIIQADISLIAFWGLILVFRFQQISSTKTELMKNLWEIGFKRDELRVKIEESGKDEEKKEFLLKIHEELGKGASLRKEDIEGYHELETRTLFTALLAVTFLIASISSALHGINLAFHAGMVDQFTYFAPFIFVFVAVLLIIYTLVTSMYKLTTELESR